MSYSSIISTEQICKAIVRRSLVVSFLVLYVLCVCRHNHNYLGTRYVVVFGSPIPTLPGHNTVDCGTGRSMQDSQCYTSLICISQTLRYNV